MNKKRISYILLTIVITIIEFLLFIFAPPFGRQIEDFYLESNTINTQNHLYEYQYKNQSGEIIKIITKEQKNATKYSIILPNKEKLEVIEEKIFIKKRNIRTDTKHYFNSLDLKTAQYLTIILASHHNTSNTQLLIYVIILIILNSAFLSFTFYPEKILKHASFIKPIQKNGQVVEIDYIGLICYRVIGVICLFGMLYIIIK